MVTLQDIGDQPDWWPITQIHHDTRSTKYQTGHQHVSATHVAIFRVARTRSHI